MTTYQNSINHICLSRPVRTVSQNTVLLESDETVFVQTNVDEQINLTLPRLSYEGKLYVIKDSTNNALSNNITITGTNIEGKDSFTIKKDGGSVSFLSTASGYVICNQMTCSNNLINSKLKIEKLYTRTCACSGDRYRLYLTNKNSIYSHGHNVDGRAGAAKHPIKIPTFIIASEQVVFIEVFMGACQSFGITQDRDVFAWGYNGQGQLGLNNYNNQNIAQKITFFSDRNIKIAKVFPTGSNHHLKNSRTTFFLTVDGLVYASGLGRDGEFGNGRRENSTIPVRCGSLENIVGMSVSSEPVGIYAWDVDGNLFVWGRSRKGGLGSGHQNNSVLFLYPTRINAVSNIVSASLQSIYSLTDYVSYMSGMLLDKDGAVYAAGWNWGSNNLLGDDYPVSSFTSFRKLPLNQSIRYIETGGGKYSTTIAITTTNELLCWGYNYNGECGTGSAGPESTILKPSGDFQGNISKAQLGGSERWMYTILLADNQLYGAGASSFGQTGVFEEKNQTFSKILGVTGEIQDFVCYGSGTCPGISVLFKDGSVANMGYQESGSLGSFDSFDLEDFNRNSQYLVYLRGTF